MESLKTMRNSIGALDGTLQLLQVTALSFLLMPSLSLSAMCPAPTVVTTFLQGVLSKKSPGSSRAPPPPLSPARRTV